MSPLAGTVAALRADGAPLIDLTVTNPTRVGLVYPPALVGSLADDAALRYDAHPFGLPRARAAVAAEIGRLGATVEPDAVMLTASTSEAYSFLFKLFCNPGDEVLVPVPSYPLFEHLARLDGIVLRPYRLEYHGVWSIDISDLRSLWGSRTRGVIVVSPNNPTGSFVRGAQWHVLAHECAARDVPLICDEVFSDYPLDVAPDAVRTVLRPDADEGTGLIVSLGGLSKSLGLPQYKLGWVAVKGPADMVEKARARLEWICDSYLSVNTPVQVALPSLLAAGADVRAAIGRRLIRNLQALQGRLTRSPACTALRVEGGWSAVVRVPALRSEEALALELVTQDHVVVHPGFFYDFPDEAFVVVSLLTRPDEFDEGIDRLCRRAEA
jgi:aspartate/methionine/tyrosine aminotransferase